MNSHTHSHDHTHDHNNGQCQQNNNHNMQQQQARHKRQVQSAFTNYSKDMKQTYDTIFSSQKLIKYYQLVRQRKRQKLEKALEANQKFLDLIIETVHSNEGVTDYVPNQVTMCHNISKIRTTVKQFFREWCGDSPEVRDYVMLVQKAKKYLNERDKILVPGCGLGRLPLELIQAGFAAQGNQVTYFMLYGSNFILNNTEHKNQYQIYPFIHSLSNHQSEQNMFRSVLIPDKLATEVVPQDADFSMAAGQFTQIYQNSHNQYNGLISCFFLDTANNIFLYIDKIHSLLHPGGIWINYGPLLYHFKDMLEQVSVELSWEQVRAYIERKGFVCLEEEVRDTTYCYDPKSEYRHCYRAVLTVWRKQGEGKKEM